MSESKFKKCPKCGEEMEEGKYVSGYGAARLVKHGDLRGDKIVPFYCKNCGYIELYRKMKGARALAQLRSSR